MTYLTTFTYDDMDYEFETDFDYGELYEMAELDYLNVCEELGLEYDPEGEYRVRSVLL